VLLAYRKLLHEEESAYFAGIIPKQAAKEAESSANPIPDAEAIPPEALPDHTDQLSFGDGGIKIISVKTFNRDGEPCTVFNPGEMLRICVECTSQIETDHINVGIRIRSREGVKIYSWGTLNQDTQILIGHREGDVFWNRRILAGENFHVWLECDCALGVNLYEIQASVSYEDKPDYSAQRMLHWMDEAAFFQVLGRGQQGEFLFGGLFDLRMTARW
jgi:lipopolysaccharide transport system ATP-binding protein